MDLEKLENDLREINDFSKQIQHLSKQILQLDFLNVIYEIDIQNDIPLAVIRGIGLPGQIIQVVQNSIAIPIKDITFDITTVPVLRRVYQEKRIINFRNLPDLVGALVPKVRYQQQVSLIVRQMGITDVLVLPLFKEEGSNPAALVAVLGPLKVEEIHFLKKIVKLFPLIQIKEN